MIRTKRNVVSCAALGIAMGIAAACGSTDTQDPGGTGGGTSTAAGQEIRSDEPYDAHPAPPTEDSAALVAGTNDFGFELWAELAAETDDNLAYSPLSTAVALAMSYEGARGNTEAQMASVLHDVLGKDRHHTALNRLSLDLAARNVAPHDTQDGPKSVKLQLVNAAWAQVGYDFLPAYLDSLAENYDAGVRLLDFAADPPGSIVAINEWVSGETAGKIPSLLGPNAITSDTRLVLTNALYFYATWEHPFDAQNTQNATFHAASDVTVPFMHQTLQAPYAEGDDYQISELPYDGGELVMTVVLPAPGQLSAVRSALSSEWLAEATAAMAAYQGEVSFAIPKFRFTWGTESFKPALVKLGMSDAFEFPTADFSGIEPKRELYISDVLHQTFIAVDEHGTEAAAATAVVMNAGGVPDPKPMTLDRPFLFLIRDTASGAVLFVGQVLNPAA